MPGEGAESAVGGVNTAIALADAEDVAEAPCSAAAASAPRMGWLGWLQGQGAAEAATGAGAEWPYENESCCGRVARAWGGGPEQ